MGAVEEELKKRGGEGGRESFSIDPAVSRSRFEGY
jgi:hypothetical protein